MELRHTQFGIIGDRGMSNTIRIELAVCELENRVTCVPLHDDTVGSLARVYGGQLRQGNFRLPVAVKIQRDMSLIREQSESVAAKFDTERGAYLRVHATDTSFRSEVPVVRYFDLAPETSVSTCMILPPCVLCRHARHSLRPRCPGCGEPLEADAWSPTDDDRCLVCTSCGKRIPSTSERKQEVIRATARHDSGCDDCVQSDDECRRSAHLLNFFPA
jgi:hypothetical protein